MGFPRTPLACQLRPGMVVTGLPGAPVARVVAQQPTEQRKHGHCGYWTSGYLVPVIDGPPILVDPGAELTVVDVFDVKELMRSAGGRPWQMDEAL